MALSPRDLAALPDLPAGAFDIELPADLVSGGGVATPRRRSAPAPGLRARVHRLPSYRTPIPGIAPGAPGSPPAARPGSGPAFPSSSMHATPRKARKA